MTVRWCSRLRNPERAGNVSTMFVCAPWGAVGEFAASRHGVITRKQAASLGFSRNLVARHLSLGYLREPTSGVLVVVGSAGSWHQQLMVATLGSNAAGVVGFRSGAALAGLDGYRAGPVEIVVPSARSLLAKIAVVHRGPLPPQDICTVGGIRCTTIARTLVDIASVDPLDVVQQAFESAWRRGTSLAWIRQTAERLHDRGQRGSRTILDLLDLANHHQQPTESALELRLERSLRTVPGLVRQHQVVDHTGKLVARVDFAVPQVRLAIEAHSREFHFGPTAVNRDEQREHRLVKNGWHVLYFGADSLNSPETVRNTVLATIGSRTAR